MQGTTLQNNATKDKAGYRPQTLKNSFFGRGIFGDHWYFESDSLESIIYAGNWVDSDDYLSIIGQYGS